MKSKCGGPVGGTSDMKLLCKVYQKPIKRNLRAKAFFLINFKFKFTFNTYLVV